jgi:hypothetical protein
MATHDHVIVVLLDGDLRLDRIRIAGNFRRAGIRGIAQIERVIETKPLPLI